jgi:signal transduction histidine kinase
MRRILLMVVWALGLMCGKSLAQPGLPLHFNYDYSNYRTHPLMWSAAQNPQGVLYFANNDGVVQFDGARWKLLPTPTGVRSIALDGSNHVFVGSKGDFGWFEPSSNGQLRYKSLKSFLPENERGTYDIDRVYARGNTIYFLSEREDGSRLIRAKRDGKTYSMRMWKFKGLINSGMAGNFLYVNEIGKGLHRLSGDNLTLVSGGEEFMAQEIVSIASKGGDDFLLATYGGRLYESTQGRIRPLSTAVDGFLAQSHIYDVAILKSGNFAIATQDNGIVVITPRGSLIQSFGLGSGLPSTNMYFVYCDREGSLWAGHGKGLTCLLPDLPMRTLANLPGMKSRITSLLEANGRLYISTISGVYSLSLPGGAAFEPIAGLTSESRTLLNVGGTVFVASNAGLFAINGTAAQNVGLTKRVIMLFPSRKDQGRFYATLEQGFGYYQNGVFTEVEGVTEEVNSVEEAPDGSLWLGTTYQGLLRLTLNGNRASTKKYGEKDGVSDGYVFAKSFGSEIYFESEQGVSTFRGDKFIKDPVMTSLVGGRAVKFEEFTPSKIWVYSVEHVLRAERSSTGQITIDSTGLANLPNEKLDAVFDAGSHAWLAYNDRLMYLDLKRETKPKAFEVVISRVIAGADSTLMNGSYWDEKGEVKLKQTEAFVPDLPYSLNSVTVQYGATSFLNPAANQYQYKIEGLGGDWSAWQPIAEVKFNNLREGTYVLKLRARNAIGDTSEITEYKFSISPPWYRTLLAYMGYVIMLGGAVFLLVRLNSRRLEAQNRKLEMIVQERTHEVNEQKKELEVKNAEISKAYEDLKTTQDQLVQSEKMAALGHLIANIAHEINTPIGAINGSASNITKSLPVTLNSLPAFFKKMSDEQERLFFKLIDRSLSFSGSLSSREERQYKKEVQTLLEEQGVEGASNLAKELVKIGVFTNLEEFIPLFKTPNAEEMLEVASGIGRIRMNVDNISLAVAKTQKIVFALKTYSHKQAFDQFEPINVNDSLETVVTLYQNQLKSGIDLTLNFDRDLPTIEAHGDELIQVWTNIIHNALQAMDNKGSLTIETKRVGDFAEVRITDSGPGIPPEVLPRIFEAFFTTKKAGEGSGLGLDICMKIIRKHNGKIDVDTVPGRTTFIISLPFHQPAKQSEEKAVAQAHS